MKIFFGIPSLTGSLKNETAISLMRTGEMLAKRGIAFETFVWSRDAILPSARNAIVAKFRTTNCSDLIMIDADIGWGTEAMSALIESNADFIAGIYRTRSDQEHYCVKMLDVPKVENGLLEVAAVPFGFVKLSRLCIDRMVDRYNDKYRINGSELLCNYLFSVEYRKGEVFSEDFEFCRKWRAIDGKIFIIDPKYAFTHVGEKSYSGSLGSMMARVAAERSGE